MVTLTCGLWWRTQVFGILSWLCQVLQAQGGGLLRKQGGVCQCECGAPPHGTVWAPRAEDGWVFFKQSSHVCRHRI